MEDESQSTIDLAREMRQEIALERLTDAAEALAKIAAAPVRRNATGFWPNLGPMLAALLITVCTALAGFSVKGIVQLRRDFDVHLPSPHARVEQRMRVFESFMAEGKRYSDVDGDRHAEISQELAAACRETDPALRGLLLDQVDKNLSAFRARR